jgi:effector-binding domain-containing protein
MTLDHHCTRSLAICVIHALVASQSATAADEPISPRSQDANEQQPIDTKEFPATFVVFKAADGPSWRMGAVFTELDQAMTETGSKGPMYIYFPNGQETGSPIEHRYEVGFLASDSVDPPEGFLFKTLPAHHAAVLSVRGPYGTVRQHYPRILDWMSEQQLTPEAGVYEIYHNRGRQSVVEIRIPFSVVDDPNASSTGTPSVDIPTSGASSAGTDHQDEAVARQSSLGDLLDRRQYVSAAHVVWPVTDSSRRRDRAWIDQVTDRLRIARAIVKRKYGGQGRDFQSLVTALIDRGDSVSLASLNREQNQPPLTTVTQQQIESTKADILRELDRLIVRAHLRSGSAADHLASLSQIVFDIEGVGMDHSPGDAAGPLPGNAPTRGEP